MDASFEIKNIWDGEISSHEGRKYVIKYPTWNQKILPSGKAVIGFNGISKGQLEFPKSIQLSNKKEDVNKEDYTVNYRTTSDWQDAFNGEITITNNLSTSIEGWTLEFDFAKDITQFWTAKIIEHEGNHYKIKHDDWNSVIKPGQSVKLGFEGKTGNVTEEPKNYILNASMVNSDPNIEKEETIDTTKEQSNILSLGDKPLEIKGEKVTVLSNVYSNSDINLEADYVRAYYLGEAAGKINTLGKDIEWKQKKENGTKKIEPKNIMGSVQKILKETEDLEVYNKKLVLEENDPEGIIFPNTSNEKDIYVSNQLIDIPGIVFSKQNIVIKGESIYSRQHIGTMASQEGNITFEGKTFFYEGNIYAPKGIVSIQADDIKIFGTIIAKEIHIKGKNCSIASYFPSADYDKDGMADKEEIEYNTNPADKDTDKDGLLDGFEFGIWDTNLLDPLKPDTDGNGVMDCDEDYDKDGLTNSEEQEYGSDPTCSDSDYDELSDIDEVKKYKTNPSLMDTDEEDVPDGDEIKLGLDPLNKKTHGIPDSEYTVEQTVSKERLKEFNNNNAYQLSVKIKSSGNADEQIDIMQSRYESSMEAFGAMIGKTLSIQYETDFKVDEMELTFQMNPKYMKNLPQAVVEDDGLDGIKRLQIFHYDEEKGTFYPIKTTYNEKKKLLKAKVKQIGEYYIVDLQQWFYQLGIGTNRKSKAVMKADKNSFFVSKLKKNKDSLFQKEKRAEQAIQKLMKKTKESVSYQAIGNQQIDIVFLIDTSKSMKSVIDDCKKNISILWDLLYQENVTPRIAVLELNKDSEKGANIYGADNVTPWAVTKKQTESLMNKITIGETGTINQIDGLEKARSLTFRNNAKKYMIMITDQGIAKNQIYESGVKNLKQMSERLKKDNISVSVVCPSEKEKQFQNLIEKTKGISVDLSINFHYYFYKWIITTKESIAFQAILPDKLLMYSSDKVPQKNNTKIDTDKDGLADSKEINWTWIKGTGKKMKLPNWNTYLKKKGVIDKESFKRLSEENRKKIFSLPVLPIQSNPLYKDSDGDMIEDKQDEYPLWSDFIINELGSASEPLYKKAKKDSYLLGVKKKFFLPINYTGKEDYNKNPYYGGNQSWFYDVKNKDRNNKKAERIENLGCGLIASANLLLYRSRNGGAYDDRLAKVNKSGIIPYKTYAKFVKKLYNYIPVAVDRNKLVSQFNNYTKQVKVPYFKIAFKGLYTGSKKKTYHKKGVLSVIKKNITLDYPVIFLKNYADDDLKYYYLENNKFVYRDYQHFDGHYVTITGIGKNRYGEKQFVVISNWGKKQYLRISEWKDLNSGNSGIYYYKDYNLKITSQK